MRRLEDSKTRRLEDSKTRRLEESIGPIRAAPSQAAPRALPAPGQAPAPALVVKPLHGAGQEIEYGELRVHSASVSAEVEASLGSIPLVKWRRRRWRWKEHGYYYLLSTHDGGARGGADSVERPHIHPNSGWVEVRAKREAAHACGSQNKQSTLKSQQHSKRGCHAAP